MVCTFGIFLEDSYSGSSVLLVGGWCGVVWCGCVVYVAWLCGFHWSCAVLFSPHMDLICRILSWSAKLWGKGELADYFGCIKKGIFRNVSLMCSLRVLLFSFFYIWYFFVCFYVPWYVLPFGCKCFLSWKLKIVFFMLHAYVSFSWLGCEKRFHKWHRRENALASVSLH